MGAGAKRRSRSAFRYQLPASNLPDIYIQKNGQSTPQPEQDSIPVVPDHRQQEEPIPPRPVPNQKQDLSQPQPSLAQLPSEERKTRILKQKTFVLKEKGFQNPFSALLISPRNVVFENQGREEEILLLLRRHQVFNLPWLISTVIVFVLPSFIFKPNFFQSLFGVTVLPAMLTAFSILWYLFAFAFFFEKFLVWYFNVGIITNERVVDVDFYGLLHRHLTDASIAKIQDVSVKQGGIVAAFLNCGDVFVQTAAETSSIEFLGAPKPVWVADLIGDLVEAQERKHEV